MENEGLSIKVEELEKKIEEEKKIIAYLEKLKSRQIEVYLLFLIFNFLIILNCT